MVVFAKSTLAFEDLNGDLGLLVLVSGEGLSLFAGDYSAAGNDLGHDTTHGFYAKGEGSDVDEKQVFSFL